MDKKPTLCIAILTLNEERRIEQCIRSAQFADQIIVADSGSTDNTVALASAMGAAAHSYPDWMGFFVAYALSKLSSAASRVWNASYAVIALMALVSVTHLSTGRTGLIVVVGALAALLFARIGLRRALVAVPILLIGVGALLMTSDVMLSRFQQATTQLQNIDNDRFSSIGHRAYNYKTTPHLIAERPLFGHGTGAYHTEICRVLDDPNDCATFRWHSHNQFLFFGADHGLVGIAFYILLIISAARVAWRSQSQPHRLMLFGLLGALVSDSLINSPLFSARESHFFLYMLALLVVMCRDTQVGMATRPPRD